MYIQHKNLVIRNAAADDADILCAWWNDGEVMSHAGFPNGLGTSVDKVKTSISDKRDDSGLFIIEADGISIGEMNYRDVGNKTAEIGIKICDFSQHGKGYGALLMSMLIRELFDEMGYSKIALDTNLNNIRAQKLYEKLGFRKIATNINSWEDQLGKWQSSIDYELVEEDFNCFLTDKKQ